MCYFLFVKYLKKMSIYHPADGGHDDNLYDINNCFLVTYDIANDQHIWQ
jgi:hypothetical protein